MNPRIAFLGAPLLTLAYGVIRIIDGLDGVRGPGLAWTTGHLAFLGALALFVVVFLWMRRLAGRNVLSTVLTAVASAGALALTVQFGIDVVAGFMADDHLAMSVLTQQVRQNPVVSLVAYDLGPYLFYLGQLALVIQLAVMRRITAWTPVLVLADLLMPFIDKDLIPLGAVILLFSYAGIARRISRTSRVAETTSATTVLV
ncbi:hypothetical protein QLQ12_36150 [Actinoplanes sp. NEAU-A12]|uniref:DUF4386 domain-containing protein n=1 Tax=Actinoplanes sandaracinus TaxID=3045177 RepID=A0ABT6WWB8_9ACTN|nr:hypothetical protein [Actinoplanes sandaracinus]MDI6104037.1 hypothetical protein [Actinoplanes sandaracinus]